MFYLIFAAVVVAMEICDYFDISETVKGIAKGVAVEGNTWLVGPKPSAKALWLRDTLVNALACAPALVAWFLGVHPAAYGFLVAPVISGIKHVQGYLAWKKLL